MAANKHLISEQREDTQNVSDDKLGPEDLIQPSQLLYITLENVFYPRSERTVAQTQ